MYTTFHKALHCKAVQVCAWESNTVQYIAPLLSVQCLLKIFACIHYTHLVLPVGLVAAQQP